jgi:2''-5'' RNA ligase
MEALVTAIEGLKAGSLRGNFTRRLNLHLTLVFIGETSSVDDITAAMDKLDYEPFEISMGGFGKFKRTGGDIYWIGVDENSTLTSVYNKLYNELKAGGFQLESREYRPHLTLGREIVLNDSFDKRAYESTIPQMKMNVSKISLMKSERTGGKLTYTSVYEKELKVK